MEILLHTIRYRVAINDVLPCHRRDQFRDNYELLTEESANYELSFNDDCFLGLFHCCITFNCVLFIYSNDHRLLLLVRGIYNIIEITYHM